MPLIDRGDGEGGAVSGQRVGEEAWREDAGGASGAKLGYSEWGSDVSVAWCESERLDLLVGQAVGGIEAVELAGVPVEDTAVAGADPEIACVAGERCDGQAGEIGVEGCEGLAVVEQQA